MHVRRGTGGWILIGPRWRFLVDEIHQFYDDGGEIEINNMTVRCESEDEAKQVMRDLDRIICGDISLPQPEDPEISTS